MKTGKTLIMSVWHSGLIRTRVAHAGSLPLEDKLLNMQYCS